jgi:hypothetical protein
MEFEHPEKDTKDSVINLELIAYKGPSSNLQFHSVFPPVCFLLQSFSLRYPALQVVTKTCSTKQTTRGIIKQFSELKPKMLFFKKNKDKH